MRDRIAKLEQQRATVELEGAFLSNMERLQAQVSGDPVPPPHPRTKDPRFAGTFFDGEQVIVDEDGEPLDTIVEDLSEG
jgi:hypothetical protein